MYQLLAAVLLFVSTNVMAESVLLDSKTINYGELNQETNSMANELIEVKRTAKTPKKVTLKYSVNYMTKKCVDFEVKVKERPSFEQVVCEAGLDGSHLCENKEYTGLYEAKTVCTKEGLVRKTKSQELVLDFRKAVKLTNTAEEIFQINIKQGSIFKTKMKYSGKASQTASLYKVKYFLKKLRFKAK